MLIFMRLIETYAISPMRRGGGEFIRERIQKHRLHVLQHNLYVHKNIIRISSSFTNGSFDKTNECVCVMSPREL